MRGDPQRVELLRGTSSKLQFTISYKSRLQATSYKLPHVRDKIQVTSEERRVEGLGLSQSLDLGDDGVDEREEHRVARDAWLEVD